MTLSTVGTDDVRASVDEALATLEKSLREVNHEVNFQIQLRSVVTDSGL